MKFQPSNIANMNAFMIVSTFFCLWLAVYFGDRAEALLAYLFVFSFGIMHGANDLKLIQRTTGMSSRSFYMRALVSYLLVIGIITVFFSFVPILALAFFVLASAYHFGEQHWASRTSLPSILRELFFMAYGMLIFFLLFYFHADEVTGVIHDVTDFSIPTAFYFYGLLVSGLTFLVFFAWIAFNSLLLTHIIEELFYLLVFYVLFQSASLIWGFSIYFVIWHSIPSLMDQVQFLSGEISSKALWSYFKSSFLYWIISLAGLGILYYIFQGQDKLFFSILVYFLAAITFPHVLVMNKVNRI
ncbi:Brp/Blh family beta-carotene 15,15'-dioxygenase [Lentiprolixibacter aurantiacus]|uniref:Probable beta-carotene 15,15'-dioxygenase n=1 Tax=Lentiprolixibacter aurantiacus TaxID=2993939 RepID=A0AAE3SQQ0_9FLAO|nr:Brp/Blh family beta-carotene 15,15'-dioxygenase [Lentiprolixibacter aurantiacus]MCX2720647.1 Brp/Blh family beta-carotene 15,15'-dioxygenase [Lentiprolixibacter aurantiacus]